MKGAALMRSLCLPGIVTAMLCLMLAFALIGAVAVETAGRVLGPGDQGEAVRSLQGQLIRRGLLAHAPDGRYGDLTRQAVAKYQAMRGVPADGLADDQTLLALYAADLMDPGAAEHAIVPIQGRSSEPDAQVNPVGAGLLAGLPASSGPGTVGPHVLQLQRMLRELRYLQGKEEGAFDSVTLQAVAAFQQDHGLAADGRADRQTLILLQNALAASLAHGLPPTQMPLWYGGGSEIIPRGAVFSVQDVATGRTFTALRMEGFSHLDAEPLTPFDTQVIHQLYGGEWSWNRRAILLRYGDQVIAASMNGMPHGFSSNAANAMPGHFCIHLYESRGHGSQRISDTHITAVLEAARATWQEE
ncbi:MAG: peptidoglycan-binding protein [Clostridiales bacterium]|nr:peptidoglycan-binding protein [Clostridiales bacterium]